MLMEAGAGGAGKKFLLGLSLPEQLTVAASINTIGALHLCDSEFAFVPAKVRVKYTSITSNRQTIFLASEDSKIQQTH